MSDTESQPNPSNDRRLHADDAPPARARELVLVKKTQRFVFRCQPGDEASLLTRLHDLARDPDVELTSFDAAMLSHQVGRQLAQQLPGGASAAPANEQ